MALTKKNMKDIFGEMFKEAKRVFFKYNISGRLIDQKSNQIKK